jgi:hypothetical protein
MDCRYIPRSRDLRPANAPGISHVDNHIVVEPSSEPEVDSADEIC